MILIFENYYSPNRVPIDTNVPQRNSHELVEEFRSSTYY